MDEEIKHEDEYTDEENTAETAYSGTGEEIIAEDTAEKEEESTAEEAHGEVNAPLTAERETEKRSLHTLLNALLCAVLGVAGGFAGGRLALKTAEPAETSPTVVIGSSDQNNTVQNTGYSLPAGELSISQIAEKASPSIVEINVETVYEGYGFFSGSYTAKGAGSGVIISEDGYIITNNHVIANATDIAVRTSDGSEYTAVLVGTDAKSDIAVIRIEAADLVPAEIGDSSLIRVGDTAVVIGNPLGTLGGTVTSGIISALDRRLVINNQALNLIQTNAAINSGNSGGGMFNGQGQLIGIVNAKDSGMTSNGALIEGLGFAIPVNEAIDVAQQLITSGHVTDRATLGVSLQTLEVDTRNYKAGVYIIDIIPGSAADAAGLKPQDCILALDGTKVASYAELTYLLKNYAIGDTVSLDIRRGEQEFSVNVTLTAPIYND